MFYRLFRLFLLEMSKQFVIFVGFIMVFDMFGRGNCFIYLVSALFLLGFPLSSAAQSGMRSQESSRLMQVGDSLRMAYRFQESLDAYEDALEAIPDSLSLPADSLLKLELHDKVLMSENGRSMTGFVDVPAVLTRRKFSIEDFFHQGA